MFALKMSTGEQPEGASGPLMESPRITTCRNFVPPGHHKRSEQKESEMLKVFGFRWGSLKSPELNWWAV